MRFSNADLATLEHGDLVVKVLKTTNKREIAVFGALAFNAPRDFFLKQYRDIVHFKSGRQILAIGKFSNPPKLEDLRGLTLDSNDLASIDDCKIGDCEVKMAAEYIQRFQKLSGSKAADSLFREMLIHSVTTYLANGNSSLGEYNDKKKPLRLANEFQSILDGSPYLFQYMPEFHSYLEKFPKASLQNAEDFVYWSKEKFGMKPVVSITHVTIYQPPESTHAPTFISSRQIYATHYFDASLGITAIVSNKSDGFYLMYLNRSRADALKGAFVGIKRALVESRSRDAMKENLQTIKQRVEATYRNATRSTHQAK